MEQELNLRLKTAAEAYASLQKLSLTTVGRQAAGDWRFFTDMRVGKSFTARKYDDVMQWFSDHWPDAEWPEAAGERPSKSEPAVVESEPSQPEAA
ncbi:hypothetical protein [Methylobacterium brachythecii]|uniref:Uncharacterized protein n=1 Tax=Methylobacterium brachythecii TaxID=1176177 RepID=A0A7W6F931_9HYPH|nr:hypothetical protein [Methylobacterium brachythecii]MBB3905088.1 hypothetical protein [Methylobacterium brachythecii]GLS44405.1 hypothetical protein GCM10007884_23930 [Methylobacterium brachythecii]